MCKHTLVVFLGALMCLASVRLYAETTDDIITLAQKGIGEEILLATVEHASRPYNLTAADIIKLKEANVPEKVIVAMQKFQPGAGAKETVIVPAREPAPAAPPAAPAAAKSVAAASGILSLENLDDKAWAYIYDPETQTIWISPPTADDPGTLAAHKGQLLKMPPGTYKVRYNGQNKGPSITVFSGEKSQLLLSRVSVGDEETLYASVFEKNERKTGGRLTILHDQAPAHKKSSDNSPRDPEPREEAAVAPPPVVSYNNVYVPSVIYTPPVYYSPYYYAPAYPYYYPHGYWGLGYSNFHHHSGFSIGVGGGF